MSRLLLLIHLLDGLEAHEEIDCIVTPTAGQKYLGAATSGGAQFQSRCRNAI